MAWSVHVTSLELVLFYNEHVRGVRETKRSVTMNSFCTSSAVYAYSSKLVRAHCEQGTPLEGLAGDVGTAVSPSPDSLLGPSMLLSCFSSTASCPIAIHHSAHMSLRGDCTLMNHDKCRPAYHPAAAAAGAPASALEPLSAANPLASAPSVVAAPQAPPPTATPAASSPPNSPSAPA